MAYSKEENAIVERANKELMRHLRAIIYHKNVITDWATMLPMVQRIMNSSVNESIGVSPAQILFGNAVTLDRGIFLPQNVDKTDKITLSKWSSDMLNKQATVIRIAQQTQRKRNDIHVEKFPAERTEFPINSYVLIEYPKSSLKKGAPTKFHTNLLGPMRVVNFVGSRYTLMNMVTNKLEDFHITQLRPFNYNAEETDPRLVAYKDNQYFEVDSIVSHSGDVKLKSTLKFIVRWTGYDPTDTSELDWKNLYHNKALHKYLRDNNLKSLIPKQYKTQEL
jgi:hypothetical protein